MLSFSRDLSCIDNTTAVDQQVTFIEGEMRRCQFYGSRFWKLLLFRAQKSENLLAPMAMPPPPPREIKKRCRLSTKSHPSSAAIKYPSLKEKLLLPFFLFPSFSIWQHKKREKKEKRWEVVNNNNNNMKLKKKRRAVGVVLFFSPSGISLNISNKRFNQIESLNCAME